MELVREEYVTIDVIEISFINDDQVEISYLDYQGDKIKQQHAKTLKQGLELIRIVDSVS